MKDNTNPYKKKVIAGQFLKEENYWMNKLSGDIKKSFFPYDYQKGSENKRNMEELKFTFTGELFSSLMKLRNGADPRLHMILIAGMVILLHKITGNRDIIMGAPALKQESDLKFINTTAVLRNIITGNMTFKELLLNVRQTVVEAAENQNYPVETLPYRLNMPFTEQDDFPLFDVAVLLENIHDKKYIDHINLNMIFSFLRSAERIDGVITFNSALYNRDTIERTAAYYKQTLQTALADIAVPVSEISIMPEQEKQKLLFDFNDTEHPYPEDKTIHQLFEDQVEKSPDNTAVSFGIDLRDIAEAMNREEPDPTLLRKFENCCFKKNPYIHRFESKAPLEVLPPEKREKNGLTAIRTHRKNYAAVNHAVFKILNVFDGRYNLKSIFNGLRDQNEDFVVFDLHSLTHFSQPGFENKEIRFSLNGEFENFVAFIKTLYSLNLVDFIDYKPGFVGLDLNIGEAEEIKSEAEEEKDLKNHDEKNASYDSPGKPAVLLLGGTAGTASVGLLYLSSFLRRNGIDAHCQWNDLAVSKPLLKENIEKLLKKTQPRVVAVSMKWFPHIARVFEICKIVKEYSSSIKVVVGGNTASYYGEDIIRRDHIDYVVMGDGEVPLLKICKNEKNIPNCLTKEAGKIINTGINYVQNEENSAPIYLSHLDEIFVTKENPFYADFFFSIYRQRM